MYHGPRKTKPYFWWILLTLLACRGEPSTTINQELVFLPPGPRAAAMLTEDEAEGYFGRVNTTDIRLQMGAAAPDSVSIADYRSWLADLPRPWPKQLEQKLRRLWSQTLTESEALFPGLAPDSIFLVLTDDLPYGAQVYFTRNMAVIMPRTDLQNAPESVLLHTMRHE